MDTVIKKYLSEAEKDFSGDDVSIRRYEAECIISDVLKIKRIDFYAKKDIKITPKQEEKINDFFERRKKNEPLQYILGYVQFRELNLKVGSGVLIPRPETEQLVDVALKLMAGRSNLRVLDVGTGSGAIALSIAKEANKAFVVGVDISSKALGYALKNKQINTIDNVYFVKTDLVSCFSDNSFDMVIANLPYVTESEYDELTPDVKDYEPKTALFAGKRGLDLIKRLIPSAAKILKANGWLLLEIGCNQGNAVKNLLKHNKGFKNISIIKDFNNLDRMAIVQKRES